MSRKVVIAVMALLLVLVTQSQSHAEQRIFEISGILKEIVQDINKSAVNHHVAFYFENGAMIVLANVPEGIVFEKGKMCVVQYRCSNSLSEIVYHFLSIECKNDGYNLKK